VRIVISALFALTCLVIASWAGNALAWDGADQRGHPPEHRSVPTAMSERRIGFMGPGTRNASGPGNAPALRPDPPPAMRNSFNPSSAQTMSAQRRPPGDAVRRAQQLNGGGRVLSVYPSSGGYRVKLLKDGEVSVVDVPN